MLVALDELFHQVVFLHLALAAEADNPGAVVLLGLVLHLVVHAGFLVFQHALGEGDGVDKFGHGQFGHLFQRVEDVHHAEVLPGGTLEAFGRGFLRGAVVLSPLALQLAAEDCQFVDEQCLHQG